MLGIFVSFLGAKSYNFLILINNDFINFLLNDANDRKYAILPFCFENFKYYCIFN